MNHSWLEVNFSTACCKQKQLKLVMCVMKTCTQELYVTCWLFSKLGLYCLLLCHDCYFQAMVLKKMPFWGIHNSILCSADSQADRLYFLRDEKHACHFSIYVVAISP